MDATVGGASSNSYITQANADAYFVNRLYSDSYDDATSGNKDAALIWATALLDTLCDWEGGIVTETQALAFPRNGIVDKEGRAYSTTAIPAPITTATCELALALLQRDRLIDPEVFGQGFSQAQVETLNVTVDKKMILDILPQTVIVEVLQLGELEPGAVAGSKVVNLIRG